MIPNSGTGGSLHPGLTCFMKDDAQDVGKQGISTLFPLLENTFDTHDGDGNGRALGLRLHHGPMSLIRRESSERVNERQPQAVDGNACTRMCHLRGSHLVRGSHPRAGKLNRLKSECGSKLQANSMPVIGSRVAPARLTCADGELLHCYNEAEPYTLASGRGRIPR